MGLLDANSGWGQQILGSLKGTFGRIFVVFNSSDNNYNEIQQLLATCNSTENRFFSSIETALAACDTNRNDILLLNTHGTHSLSAMLDITISRLHIMSLDTLLGVNRKQGQGAKIALGVTTDTDDIFAIKNTGVRNTFHDLKITTTNTLTQCLYAFGDGGEYTEMSNCEVAFLAKLTTATVADMLCNGDGSQYKNCSIGSTVNEITANGTRPNVLVSRETITGKVARDVRFIDCDFLYKCGDTDNRLVYGANANDVERMMTFDNCKFINNPLSAQSPGAAVDFGSAQTQGAVYLDSRCGIVDITVMGATGKGIYTNAPSSPTYATSGRSVAS